MKQKRNFGALPALLGLAAALLLACGPEMPTSQPTTRPPATVPPTALSPTAGPAAATITPPAGELITTATGLKYIEIVKGEGASPKTGEIVLVHYRGMLDDGTEFDSSYTRGEPISFPLGTGRVIPGWDEGIALMSVGGKGQLIIPPELGYGEQGAGGVIPPNATLVFDVELVGIRAGSPAAPTQVKEEDLITTASGLKYYDLEEGDGAVAQSGQNVTVDYTGWLTDGVKFDSSIDRGEPFSFLLGSGGVIKGWDEGVAGMKVGGKRQLVIPPDLGYGASGAGGVIPPNATLIFEVWLISVP